jgi:hypothetical protein
MDRAVVEARIKEAVLKAEYHKMINEFQAIQELARNSRQEMKSLHDGI